MKLLELFENKIYEYLDLNPKAYGWWMDGAGNFHEVEKEGHERFLRNTLTLSNSDSEKYTSKRSWAFGNNWIRIGTEPTIQGITLGITGTKEALKKHLPKIIKLAKNYESLKIDIVNMETTSIFPGFTKLQANRGGGNIS